MMLKGGKVKTAEHFWPWALRSSATTPPMLPTLLPP
jgi:hypothetical protein